MKINNCMQLWEGIGGEKVETEETARLRLEKSIFKYTECGCVFNSDDEGIYVGGYAEGSDAELPTHYLKWGFTMDEYNDTLEFADEEGVTAWHEAHDQDLGNMITEEEWKDGTF